METTIIILSVIIVWLMVAIAFMGHHLWKALRSNAYLSNHGIMDSMLSLLIIAMMANKNAESENSLTTLLEELKKKREENEKTPCKDA